MWQSYMNGLLVALGLIMAIGSQNAFVLAQSLRREHHLPVAALCVVCDALLVAAGVFGLATILAQSPILLGIARWGGAAFLLWYGACALRRACSKQSLDQGDALKVRSLRAVLLSALAVTLLKPPRLLGHRAADWLAGRPTDRTRRLCGRRGQRFVPVVRHAGARRRLVGPVASTSGDVASARPSGGGDDVQRGLSIDQCMMNIPKRSGTSIPHSCCVVLPHPGCYDPDPAPQRVQTPRRLFGRP